MQKQEQIARLKSFAFHLTAFLMLVFVAWKTPQLTSLDYKLNDIALQSASADRDNNIVIVEINQSVINDAGSMPISRAYMATALETIARKNPERVLIDMLYSADGVPEQDRAFAQALKALGRDRIGIGAINAVPNNVAVSPNIKFLPFATPVGVGVYPDRDGFHRHVKIAETNDAAFANPALWLTGVDSSRSVIIDQTISPTSFPRVSLKEFANGNGPDLTGKLVIIGQASSLQMGGIHYPFHQAMDRMTLYALGAATVINGNERSYWSFSALVSMVLLLGSLAALIVRFSSKPRYLTLASASVSVMIAVGSYWGLYHAHMMMQTLFFLFTWNSAVLLSLAYKYRLIAVAREVFSGDLSPEEAWAWRTMKMHQEPAILLSLGGVKRANKAAVDAGVHEAKGKSIRDIRAILQLETSKTGWSPASVHLDVLGGTRTFTLSQPFDDIGLVQLRDVTDVVAEQNRVKKLLEQDSLTGCYNKTGFEKALNDIATKTTHYSVLMLDMNGFKAANDTYGHQAGDVVLIKSAERFAGVLRRGDVLARLGGDEFAVLIEGEITEAGLLTIRDNLENSLGGKIHVDGADIPIGVAAGFAHSSDYNNHHELMDAADKSMYARKAFLKSSGNAIARDAPLVA